MHTFLFRLSLILLLCALLPGCYALAAPETVPTPQSTFTTVPTSSPTTELTTTATTSPSPTVEPTATIEPAPTQEIIPICAGEGNPISPPDDFHLPGSLVLKVRDRQELLIVGGAPLEQSRVAIPETHRIQALSFSPDENWLAYVPVTHESDFAKIPVGKIMVITGTEIILETPSIVLLSSSGERIERDYDVQRIEGDILEGDYLQSIISLSWINDHLLRVLFTTNNYDPYSSSHSLYEIYDPFENVWLDNPNDQIKDRDPDGKAAFSPDMSRVLYNAKRGDQPAGLVLRDLENDSVIWSDPDFDADLYTFMIWTRDSQMVAVANRTYFPEKRRAYLITRDGLARQIVDEQYPASEFLVNGMSWSPNGRYLTIENKINQISNLYIFDTESDHYLFSCPLMTFLDGDPYWIWSPDNRYLAVSSIYTENQYPLELLDVQTGQVIELLPDGNLKVDLEDWLVTFPFDWLEKVSGP